MKFLGENSKIQMITNVLKDEKILDEAGKFVSEQIKAYRNGFINGMMVGGILCSLFWIIVIVLFLYKS